MENGLMRFSYETALGTVELDTQTVKQYLTNGNGAISDQEAYLFAMMCKSQKLNPFNPGEAYLIKFGSQPAQMVVGYDTYKRRADDNPSHLYTESGIVVLRGSQIVQKAGACLYPSEQLVGGWCRVHKKRLDREVVTFKEVGFNEYNKGNAIWKEKPCTMIEKVAISQCLREAYPKDYEGLYTAEELAPAEYEQICNKNGEIITDPVPMNGENIIDCDSHDDTDPAELDRVITQDERKALFNRAQGAFGKAEGNDAIKALIGELGIESTAKMTVRDLKKIHEMLDDLIEQSENAGI